jgi:hypothetical protein
VFFSLQFFCSVATNVLGKFSFFNCKFLKKLKKNHQSFETKKLKKKTPVYGYLTLLQTF